MYMVLNNWFENLQVNLSRNIKFKLFFIDLKKEEVILVCFTVSIIFSKV